MFFDFSQSLSGNLIGSFTLWMITDWMKILLSAQCLDEQKKREGTSKYPTKHGKTSCFTMKISNFSNFSNFQQHQKALPKAPKNEVLPARFLLLGGSYCDLLRVTCVMK